MSRHAAIVALVAALSLPAMDMDVAMAEGARPEILDVVGMPPADVQRPASIYMVIPAQPKSTDTQAAIVPKAAKYTVYLNRDGGTYTPGFNDSRTNRSSVPTRTATIQPWDVSERGWQRVMTCVQDIFAPFNVEITDVDPGDAPHIESVVAGRPQDVGLQAGVAGVSPFTNDCSVIDNSIVYTFAEVMGNDYQFICEVVAQEVAHSFGLDHEYLCEDPMSYISGCGAKTFQDVDADCGEFEPRECYCNGSTQNSVQLLNQRIGPAGGDNAAPAIDFASPQDGDVVSSGSTINIDVADDVAVSRVELYIDGLLLDATTSAPFDFVMPELSPGTYVLEARAYDSQNVSIASIAVTIAGDGSGAVGPENPQNPELPGAGSSDLIGGCQTSGQGTGGSMLYLIGLALFLVRRRLCA